MSKTKTAPAAAPAAPAAITQADIFGFAGCTKVDGSWHGESAVVWQSAITLCQFLLGMVGKTVELEHVTNCLLIMAKGTNEQNNIRSRERESAHNVVESLKLAKLREKALAEHIAELVDAGVDEDTAAKMAAKIVAKLTA